MSFFSKIGAWLLGISSKTLAFIKGAVIELAKNPELQAIAMSAVMSAEAMAVDGIQKKAAAESEILGRLAAAGLPVVQKQINLAIEAAVANLSNDK